MLPWRRRRRGPDFAPPRDVQRLLPKVAIMIDRQTGRAGRQKEECLTGSPHTPRLSPFHVPPFRGILSSCGSVGTTLCNSPMQYCLGFLFDSVHVRRCGSPTHNCFYLFFFLLFLPPTYPRRSIRVLQRILLPPPYPLWEPSFLVGAFVWCPQSVVSIGSLFPLFFFLPALSCHTLPWPHAPPYRDR